MSRATTPRMDVTLTRDEVRGLTKNSVKAAVFDFGKRNPDKGSFVLSDLPDLGTYWGPMYVPFFKLYGESRKVAAQEMGKILSLVADEMGLRRVKENRFGKKDAITRYFF